MVREKVGPVSAEHKEYLGDILSASKHLLVLINDILDLSKVEAGKIDLRPEPVHAKQLVAEVRDVVRGLAAEKDLRIDVSVDPTVDTLVVDPSRVKQILYNFLSNAIKFSPQGARIDLAATVEPDGEHVRISVTDRGPGIATEKQQLIFEKFRQLEPSHTRTHGGTGLGLAISKELAILLGGSIGVRSTPGEGSAFWLVVPLKIASGSMEMRGRLVLT
jgi:signal transduction histidine kinase